MDVDIRGMDPRCCIGWGFGGYNKWSEWITAEVDIEKDLAG